MSKSAFILRGVALACALSAASLPALAQNANASTKHSGPSRWYTGDSTKQQRTATLKKEINAAYAEQQTACKHKAAGKRDDCMKQARLTYQHDMKNVPQLLASAPKGEVSERVVSTSPSTPDTPMQPGSSAVGSSAAGSTGSGSDMKGDMGSMGSSGAGGTTGSSDPTHSGGNDNPVPTNSGQTGGLPPPSDQSGSQQLPPQTVPVLPQTPQQQ